MNTQSAWVENSASLPPVFEVFLPGKIERNSSPQTHFVLRYKEKLLITAQILTITWYGQSCFKIETRGVTLAIDPFSKELGLTPPRFQADIVLVTHGHFDHSNIETIPGSPFVISGPGEYETKGIAIRGISTFHDASGGRERGMNTCYVIEAEDMTIAHLGDFGEHAMREETVEELGEIDILMIPVGGTYTIDGDAAAKVVHQIEPSLVIPMHYAIEGLKVKLAPVSQFLKAYGATSAKAEPKLVIKKKDVTEGKTRVALLATS